MSDAVKFPALKSLGVVTNYKHLPRCFFSDSSLSYRSHTVSQKWTPLLSFCLLSNFITSSIIRLWGLFKQSKNKADTDVSHAVLMFLNHHKPITYIHPRAGRNVENTLFLLKEKRIKALSPHPLHYYSYVKLPTSNNKSACTGAGIFISEKKNYWDLACLMAFFLSQQNEFSGVQEGKCNYGFSANVHGPSWFLSGWAVRAPRSVVSSHAS